MSTSVQVTFDAADPRALGTFWCKVLGYVEQPPPPGFDTWEAFGESVGLPPEAEDDYYAIVDPANEGPRIFIQRVPEPKTAKNRVHLDIDPLGRGVQGEERQAALTSRAAELVALGATQLYISDEPTGWAVVLADPEGNEFCLH